MLIALLCESEMKLTDESIEIILDKVHCHILNDISMHKLLCSSTELLFMAIIS